MGFLSAGTTFGWSESESVREKVKRHGIIQFLNFYNASKNRDGDPLKWGDEIEYIVLNVDRQNKKALLSLRGQELLDKLTEDELKMIEYKKSKKDDPSIDHSKKVVAKTLWRPEYGVHMVEGTPGKPYGKRGLIDLLSIQASMRERRETVEKLLKPDEIIVTLTNYPLLGARQQGPFTFPHHEVGGPVAKSIFTPDQLLNPHQRFPSLTRNIRERAGRRIEIYVPLFRDTHTTTEPLPLPPAVDDAKRANYIYMDSMAFGMGCCCLQNVREARWMYDQFGVLSPILLALTAATPIVRGYLSDNDVRWSIIAGAVDDRDAEERGIQPLEKRKKVLPKSRYESISLFIDENVKSKYNDLNAPINDEAYAQLKEGGIDDVLSTHIAHLFTRDPLVIYRDRVDIDDLHEGDHFENINSTNWQTVRFKIPPADGSIGWRVEFRPMEVQFTDFENAAYVAWTILTYEAIKTFDLEFYVPMSKVDENMITAHRRGASRNLKFYFRKNIERGRTIETEKSEDEYELMTMNEIFHGKGSFPGTQSYLYKIKDYIDFVGKRASGELMNNSEYVRNLVLNHPQYKHDSIINHDINYDIIEAVHRIENGTLVPKEMLGDYVQAKPNGTH
ncbi:hypothetical protein PROFUN_11673 [Planoprotostelium fungivorum]|uniref:Glutamate--cysteine ligase n=1 Tax=Planoprotostelium fungivorum TaxID=1890364 RepID=A0A2P6N597_9EUKA|nr:hypothetical protein PROFUN_11673 [Planoprotostelium fungivorum]